MRTLLFLLTAALLLLAAVLALSATARAADVTLAWDYPDEAAHDGFRLRFKRIGGEYEAIDLEIPPDVRRYIHANAPHGALLYKLTAFDANAESAGAYLWGIVENEPAGPPPRPGAVTTVTITVTPPTPAP